jgi:stage II sporulation protein D
MTGSRPTIPTATRPIARRARTAIAGCLLIALAGAALAAAPAARGASPTTLTLEGRGWGHGIGMSQYGADGYAQHGWKYGAIIKHYYTGVTLG